VDIQLEDGSARRAGLITASVAVVGAVGLLVWAKWAPYADKAWAVGSSRRWSGASVLDVGGVKPGDPPSLSAALSFTAAYGLAVWKALVAALLISAAVSALVPRTWLLRVFARPGRLRSAALGGLLSTPSMMCTCCAAPVVVGLRRGGVPTAAAVAYWLGNPLLNPAVLVFLALVAPWPWTVTRAVVGLVLVVGGAAVVAVLNDSRSPKLVDPPGAIEAEPENWLGTAPRRFLRALTRLVLILVPEYLVVVMLVGAVRGWLFPVAPHSQLAAPLLVLVVSLVGTLIVIPTAAEIPVLQALALAGVASGALGALLITLPAVSLPGIAMVGRALGWRTTLTTTLVVILGGVLGAGMLTLVS
jgi:uncharacterized membrane protein YraQ (UPF0718 family)